MTLIEHIIDLVVAMQSVQDLVGRNETFSDLADQLVIRDGILHADDPYPGIVVDLPTQEHEKDLQERGGLIHASLEVRCISFSKPQAWNLRSAVAFDGGDPNDPDRLTGLDGFRDVQNRFIWGIGLRTETTEHIPPSDGEDRDVWIVESVYNVDYRETL